jgi:VWFA-related protein
MGRRMRLFCALLACCLLSTATTWSVRQDPSPPQATFRSGVDIVHVDVSVLDKDRHPVHDLTAADFVVREDGKVRPITAFSAVTLTEAAAPAPRAGWMLDVSRDTATNVLPREGRLVVILLDRTIPTENMPWARRTAEAAVDQLGPGDLAAVIYTVRGVPQNFTADRKLLKTAIDQPFLSFPDDGSERERGECWCGLCSLQTITNVADAVRDVPQRRKMLLFIGSTLPLEANMSPDPGPLVTPKNIVCNLEIKDAREKLLRAAGAANLAIHTFDATLLDTLAPSASTSGVPPTDRTELAGANLRRLGNLAFYPDETGGRAIKNSNAPWEPVADVFAETASYYVLGFTPAAAKADGKYHDIKVDVRRRDVSIHARQGFYSPSPPARSKPATPGGPPQSLVDTLAGLWPVTEIPLSVSVAAFANPGKPEANLAIVIRAQEPVAVDPGRTGRADASQPAAGARVNVLAGAYGRDGRPMDSHTQTLAVRPSPGATREFEYEVLSKLRLKPGRHEIRVAAEDVSRQLRGSVYTYVDIPDFSKAAVSVSGIVLSTTSKPPAAALGDVLPLTPTAQRQFASTARVTAFLRVYEGGGGAAAAPVTVSARILDEQGGTSFEQSTPVSTQGAPIRSADYRLDLPLSRLAAGEYLLTIEAHRGNRIARRDVRFGVRSTP